MTDSQTATGTDTEPASGYTRAASAPAQGRPDEVVAADPAASMADMPGLGTLQPWACARCGFWQRWFPAADGSRNPPPGCPACRDVRAGLPSGGWDFATPEEVDARLRGWVQEDSGDEGPGVPGVRAHRSSPRVGVDNVGWVITTDDGAGGLTQLGVDAAPCYDDAGVERLRGSAGTGTMDGASAGRLGGASAGRLAALALTHPHTYGAAWRLQDALRPEVLAVGVPDLTWTAAFRVTWPVDEPVTLAPGITAHLVGGHFPGQVVVHDAARGALFCGDVLKVEVDRGADRARALSVHKGYEVQIPMGRGEVRHYREVLADLDFEHVFTPFEHGPGVTRAHVLAFFDHLLAGAPTTGSVPLADLGTSR